MEVYKISNKLNQERINEILRVEKENKLTAENLLAEASKVDNPLHELFEWDDTEAANQYRLFQARVLINEVKVIIDSKEYYAFENVQVSVDNLGGSETTTERVCKPIVEILSNEDLREQIIFSALRQHEYWEKQNEKYSELSPIVKSAKKIRHLLQEKWQ
jgi:hypothetical protein